MSNRIVHLLPHLPSLAALANHANWMELDGQLPVRMTK